MINKNKHTSIDFQRKYRGIKKIGFYPEEFYKKSYRLIKTLEELEPIEIGKSRNIDDDYFDANIIFATNMNEILLIDNIKTNKFVFVDQKKLTKLQNPNCNEVKFTNSHYINSIIREKELFDTSISSAFESDFKKFQILGTKDRLPFWLSRMNDNIRLDVFSGTPPFLLDGQYLFDYLEPGKFTLLLPLLEFIKSLWPENYRIKSQLKATFLIDDPNLHWPKYGCADFKKLRSKAKKYNYHISFATIPADTWFTHRDAAKTFREGAKYISLLMHGNNHVKREFALKYEEETKYQVGAQSIRRIKRLENKGNIQVARISVPPHEAFCEEMSKAFLKVGYEAMCLSRSSLMRYNKRKSWPLSIGFKPSILIENGLPIIPRFKLFKYSWSKIFIAAYLHQPIIPVGHHRELSSDCELLNDIGSKINSLGKVEWTDCAQIARKNYLYFFSGETMYIETFSLVIKTTIPHNIKRIVIKFGHYNDDEKLNIKANIIQNANQLDITETGDGIFDAIVSPGDIKIVFNNFDQNGYLNFPNPRFNTWSLIRRFFAETRDRLQSIDCK